MVTKDIYEAFECGGSNIVNWKRNPEDRIPSPDNEKINVFYFNYHGEEPLAPKTIDAEMDGDTIIVYWTAVGDFNDTFGMQDEIYRWLDTVAGVDIDIRFYVCSRDGYGKKTFLINYKKRR